VPAFSIYRLSVQKYQEMIQKQILTEQDPVELLEGWIVTKMPRYPAHDTAIDLTEAALRPVLPAGFRIRVQNAITTSDSQPEPDIAVVTGDLRAYASRHPGPEEIALLVEVADSSLDTDRSDKARVYARAGVLVYWIVNLVDRQVEVYTDPDQRSTPPAYRRRDTYLPGQSIPVLLKGQTIAQIPAQELLP
jgi:Uma2 family endonuclease